MSQKPKAREPTETEQRCIDAAFEAAPAKLHLEDAEKIVRAVITELHKAVDDPDIWNAFAGDDVMWRDRRASGVFRRYLELMSPRP